MMKNIIFENDPDFSGIPPQLREILATRFTENREYWYGFSDRFRADPQAAMVMLAEIPSGTNIIGQTNFHEEDQLERFTRIMQFFMEKGLKMNFYTVLEEQVFGTIEEAFGKYISRNEAFFTPLGYDKKQYKQFVNHMLLTVLEYHNMYRMVSVNPSDDRKVTYENCVLAAHTAPAMSA
jgi:hypothetical protein